MNNKKINELEKELEKNYKLKIQIDKKENNIKNLISTEEKEYLKKVLPKKGEYIYIPENWTPFDNLTRLSCGGLVKVVERDFNPQEYFNLTIVILGNSCECESSHNEHSYDISWKSFAKRQEELKNKYGSKKARIDDKYYKDAFEKMEIHEFLVDATEPW